MTITDQEMQERIAQTKEYSLLILHGTEKLADPASRAIVWEHGRRNFQLRAEGLLHIVCPVADGSDVSGIGIFGATVEKTRQIMDADPGVQAGIFTYEIHPCRAFPGDSLK